MICATRSTTSRTASTSSTLATRIQHHPSRAALIPPLLDGLAGLDAQVVADPDPDGHPDAWRTHRACLDSMPDDATHLLVIQDDALPQPGFAAKILHAIEERPEHLLLAFVPGFPRERRGMMEARKAGARYARFQVGAYTPTVCTVYPRAVAEGFLAWADHGGDRYRRPVRGADDGALAHYCRLRRLQPLMLVPSICDHRHDIISVRRGLRTGAHRRAALL